MSSVLCREYSDFHSPSSISEYNGLLWGCTFCGVFVCLFVFVFIRRPPFTAYNQEELTEKINVGKFRRIPYRYSDELNTLLCRMLHLKVCLDVTFFFKNKKFFSFVAGWKAVETPYINVSLQNASVTKVFLFLTCIYLFIHYLILLNTRLRWYILLSKYPVN